LEKFPERPRFSQVCHKSAFNLIFLNIKRFSSGKDYIQNISKTYKKLLERKRNDEQGKRSKEKLENEIGSRRIGINGCDYDFLSAF
jgi:hypothetical protein